MKAARAKRRGSTTYGYDRLDRVVSVSHDGQVLQALEYDGNGRQTATHPDGASEDRAYDDAGNLTSADEEELAYNDADHVTDARGVDVGHDEAGNMTSRGG
ncbi:hypothetical protein, partial [Nocardiopsis synnemataformans]|uniref:hypothetical protein n=1 Tax=Nocardiopsis synnemataformans TaxID=61305 RepID=UPI003EBADB79